MSPYGARLYVSAPTGPAALPRYSTLLSRPLCHDVVFCHDVLPLPRRTATAPTYRHCHDVLPWPDVQNRTDVKCWTDVRLWNDVSLRADAYIGPTSIARPDVGSLDLRIRDAKKYCGILLNSYCHLA